MTLDEADYRSLINGMAAHYVEMMPSKDYQMVGRDVDIPGQDRSLGLIRVDFDDRNIYANDIESGQTVSSKDLVAGPFCNIADRKLIDYSCEPSISLPLANISSKESSSYDFYFEEEALLSSIEVQMFFEDLFGVTDIEEEWEVQVLDE